MWGPLEAVQYAVRVNAERLGIAYSDILACYPVFEGAGDLVQNVISTGPSLSGNNKVWSDSAIDLGTTRRVYSAQGRYYAQNLCILLHTEPIVASATRPTILMIHTGTTNQYATMKYFSDTQLHVQWLSYLTNYVGTTYEAYIPHPFRLNTPVSICWELDGTRHNTYTNGIRRHSIENTSQPAGITAATVSIELGYCQWETMGGQNVHGLNIFKQATPGQIATLSALPYALLMPVSRPVYFDLGAGGGASLTILQALQANIASTGTTYADLSAGIATPAINNHDLRAVIAMSGICANDLWATIATSGTVSQDMQSAVATDAAIHQALQAAIATEITTCADLLLTVSELIGTVVSQDLRLSIATAQTGLADLQTSIATLGEIHQGLQLAVATSLTTLHDTSIQIAELIGTIVRQDLQLVIASELQRAQVVALSVASAASTAQTTLAAVATEQTTAAPLTVEVTTLLESLADLELRIESIVTSVVSQNLRLGIATEMAVLQDLRLTVAEITDVLTAVFEVPARFKTFTLPTRNKTFRV
jgi:hypothetical protein